MTIEEIIIKEAKSGNLSPLNIAKKHNLNLASVRTSMWQMRKEGRLPQRQRKEKPSFYD